MLDFMFSQQFCRWFVFWWAVWIGKEIPTFRRTLLRSSSGSMSQSSGWKCLNWKKKAVESFETSAALHQSIRR